VSESGGHNDQSKKEHGQDRGIFPKRRKLKRCCELLSKVRQPASETVFSAGPFSKRGGSIRGPMVKGTEWGMYEETKKILEAFQNGKREGDDFCQPLIRLRARSAIMPIEARH